MQLDLYTPKPDQALKQAPETRPAITAEWLKQFDTMNPEDAAQKLLAELGRLNRSEVEDDLRAKLTLLYEPVVHRLIDALALTLPENGTPQSPLHRQAANLAYEMALELGYAWKMVYLGSDRRLSLFSGGKARQTALNHLLSALSTQICTSYRVYTSPPVNNWRELHQVHETLDKEGVADKSAGNPRPSHEFAYQRALLLALSDPFRLTRPEIEVTLAYLDKYGQLAKIGKGCRNKPSCFLINSATDAPFQQDGGEEGPEILTLDTHDLCKHLRSLIVKLKTGEVFRDIGIPEASPKINALHLLSRLHQSWRGASKRVFKRYEPELSYVEVVSGIPAIHRLYGSSPNAMTAVDKFSTPRNPAVLSDQSKPARWRVVNDSANGLAISSHAREVAQVRMGNPIALREENAKDETWTLAVIRWGKMSKGQIVVAGVEKLAPNASSVVLRFSDGDAANIGQPALLIPANPVLQTDERLLIPQGLYKRSRPADMWHKGEKRRVGLGSLVEETAFFDIVELEPA